MEINTTTYKRCDLISVTGRIDSATAPQLSDTLNALMEEGRYRFVLDLSGTTFLSSAGLRVLINTQKNCKRHNRGEVVLACIPQNIHAALDLSGFVPLFRFFNDVLTAVGNI